MSEVVSEAQVAMVRGVKSCGGHHEENKLAPAIEFARVCDHCAGNIFVTIWNSGAKAQADHMQAQWRR